MQIRLFKNEQLPTWHLNGDIGGQQWQFIFSLFVKLTKKNLIFQVDMLSLYGMKELWTAVKKFTNFNSSSAEWIIKFRNMRKICKASC